MSRRIKVWYVIAFAGSILCHLLIAAVAAVISSLSAHANLAKAPEPVTLTLLESPSPTPTPEPPVLVLPAIEIPKEPEFVRTTEEQEAETPERVDFESDRNTRAVSQDDADPNGEEGMPSVKAEKREWVELQNQQYSPKVGPGSPSNSARPQPAQPEIEASPTPEATPKETPTPSPTPKPAPSATPTDTPSLKPSPTPSVTPRTPTPDALLNEVALPTPTPTPRPSAAPTVIPIRKATAVPQQADGGGRRTESRKSELMGTISLKGRTAAFNAAATPIGKYKAEVVKSIEERWRFYMHSKRDLMVVGTATIRFTISTTGKVQNIQLLSNTANETFASYTIRAVTEAKLSSMSTEVSSVLERGRLEMEIPFSLIP